MATCSLLPLAVMCLLLVGVSVSVGRNPHCPHSQDIPHNCSCSTHREHQVLHLFCGPHGLTSLPLDLPAVDQLHLEGNALSTLGAVSYPALKWLSLPKNGIYHIEDGAFTQLKQLRTLNLQGNHLSRLTNSTFAGLSALHLLSLKDNPLYEVGAGVLGGQVLSSLQTLDISGCSIYEFSPQAFDVGSPLMMLNASDNRLSSFSFVHRLKALKVLDMSFNRIAALSRSPFLGLAMLDDLHLSHNDLRVLEADSLQGLTRMKKLLLDHNVLRQIEHSAFRHSLHLQYLDLTHNQFRHLERDRLPWSSVKKLLVHHNPWHCGCRTAWLRSSEVLINNIEQGANLTCASPLEVETAPVVTINRSFFDCVDEAKRASERALAIGLGVVIGLIIAMLATIIVYRLVFRVKRRRARDGTLTVSASSPYSRVDSRELVLKNDDM